MTKEAANKIRELRETIRTDLNTLFEHLQGVYKEMDGLLEGLENANNMVDEVKDE